MSPQLQLRAGSQTKLARYLARQLDGLFPDESIENDEASVITLLDAALDRMRPILEASQFFKRDTFDHFHSMQYACFLYLLSTEAAANGLQILADRIFCLNRALNGLDLYHQVVLGEVFLIGHGGAGTVLGNAVYGSRCLFFQNVTVGRVGENRPTIGSDVILFPGSSVTGASRIGNNCVVSAKTSVHNIEVPDNSLVTSAGQGVDILPLRKDYMSLYFRK